jgi:CII-binding regulator of phage lambda lysogenization HflD
MFKKKHGGEDHMSNEERIVRLETIIDHIDRDLDEIKHEQKETNLKIENVRAEMTNIFKWLVSIIVTTWLSTIVAIVMKH